jgi:hypothetical protein
VGGGRKHEKRHWKEAYEEVRRGTGSGNTRVQIEGEVKRGTGMGDTRVRQRSEEMKGDRTGRSGKMRNCERNQNGGTKVKVEE